jgi:hypothetical protein
MQQGGAAMPLLDHFHPPILRTHSWESFRARWAVTLADLLNEQLPDPRYLVEVQVTVGARIEADVAEWKLEEREHQGNGLVGGLAMQTWTVPAAARSIEFTFPDDIEVRIHDCREGKRLVGVIELVSPSNKDRPDNRRAFAARCLTYLHRGIGVLVADIVTERRANLHNELLALLEQERELAFNEECNLYAVAYRAVRREERNLLEWWPEALALDLPLPVLPLALKDGPCVPIALEATYTDARRRSRL